MNSLEEEKENTASQIEVIDDFLDQNEVAQLYTALNGPIWRFGWDSERFADTYKPAFHALIAGKGRKLQLCAEEELNNNGDFSFLRHVWERAKDSSIQHHRLLGVYGNGQMSDQESLIHRDNKGDMKGKTLILFANEFWPIAWGGALNFYDSAISDVIKSVIPKPGRAVIFPGDIPHNANAPSNASRLMRMTVAFKTIQL